MIYVTMRFLLVKTWIDNDCDISILIKLLNAISGFYVANKWRKPYNIWYHLLLIKDFGNLNISKGYCFLLEKVFFSLITLEARLLIVSRTSNAVFQMNQIIQKYIATCACSRTYTNSWWTLHAVRLHYKWYLTAVAAVCSCTKYPGIRNFWRRNEEGKGKLRNFRLKFAK